MIPYVMRGEILPRHLRGPGGATTDIISSGFAIMSNYIYIALSDNNIHWALWIYAIIILAFATFVIVFVPETKDQTLHEIQQKLKR